MYMYVEKQDNGRHITKKRCKSMQIGQENKNAQCPVHTVHLDAQFVISPN